MNASDNNPWLAVPAAYRNLPAFTPVPLIALDFSLDTFRSTDVTVTEVLLRNAHVDELGSGFDAEIFKGGVSAKWGKAGVSARRYGPEQVSIETSIQANVFARPLEENEYPQIQSNVASLHGRDFGVRVIVRLDARVWVMEEERAAAIASFNERARALLARLQSSLALTVDSLPDPAAPPAKVAASESPQKPRRRAP